MSASSGPEIINDGLVFAYDMGNDKKSWKGKPTTNLAKNTSGNIDWSVGQLNIPISRTTIVSNERYILTTTSLTGSSWRMYFNPANLINGQTYTLSFKYTIISGGPTFYAGDWCDTSVTRTTTDLGNGVFYQTATGTRATYDSTYRFMDFVQSTDTVVEIWDLQLEQSAYASPYVESKTSNDRTNTTAIIDWAGKRTLTVNSLNYNTDNTFNFKSQSANISIPSFNIPREKTLSIWIRSDRPLSGTDNWEIGFLNSGTTQGSMFGFMYGVGNCQDLGYWGYGSAYDMSVEAANNKWSSDGNWHNAVITMDSSRNVRVWIDGEQKQWLKHTDYSTKVDYVTMPIDTTNNFVINSRGPWDSGMTYVDLGNVTVYDRALTNNEIKQNFNALRARFGI